MSRCTPTRREEELRAEFLSMDIALAVVDGLDAAIDHVNEYGTGHTEAIVATNLAAAQRFSERVDAAAVMVNASTAFTDGEQFGFGAEIGISTQKLHARGPMGLPELTSTKWIVWGDGHTRPAYNRRKLRERPRTPGTAVRRHRRCRATFGGNRLPARHRNGHSGVPRRPAGQTVVGGRPRRRRQDRAGACRRAGHRLRPGSAAVLRGRRRGARPLRVEPRQADPADPGRVTATGSRRKPTCSARNSC